MRRILPLSEVQTCESQQADGAFTVRAAAFPHYFKTNGADKKPDFIIAFQLLAFVWLWFYYRAAAWRDYGFNASGGGKTKLRSVHPAGWVTVRCTYQPCRSNTWQKSLLRVKLGLHTLYSSPCVCMWVWNSCDETSSGPEWQSRQNAHSFHPRPLIAFIPCTNC